MASTLRQLVEIPKELNAGSIRKLHSELTEALARVEGMEFVWALIYKGLYEELLRNLIEDDRVPNVFASASASLLTTSFAEALAVPERSQSAWHGSILEFAKVWTNLPVVRKHLPVTECRSLRFAVATSKDSLLWGAPLERQLDDASYRFFPTLDDSILDPVSSAPIVNWFSNQIAEIVERKGEEGVSITNLVFVEKPFSYVGAVLLASQLVERSGIAGLVYRSAYWDDSAKFRGPRPKPGGAAILVYDVSIHGSILEEAAKQLDDQYAIQTVAALVGYDFSHGAFDALAALGIELRSFDTRRAAQDDLLRIDAVRSRFDFDGLVTAGIEEGRRLRGGSTQP